MIAHNVSVVIPAHNEETIILQTLESLLCQTIKPNTIIIACDNCTDNTVNLIHSFNEKNNENIIIFQTVNNFSKKAGALNQIFNNIKLNEYVLIMDADTVVSKNALEEGLKILSNDKKLGAICSRAGIMPFRGKNLYQKLIWSIQHIEYGSFDSHRVETENKIKVAHGMATLFKYQALKDIPTIRKSILDINTSNIYLEDNLVEDYEITLCLKHKWNVSSCLNMLAFTDVPLSLKELFIQRVRWLRGGVDTLRLHSLNKITLFEILNHFLFIFLTTLRLITLIASLQYIFIYGFNSYSFILTSIILFSYIDSIYRLKYVQSIETIDYIVKFLLIPEILYNWIQAIALILSYILSFFNIKQRW